MTRQPPHLTGDPHTDARLEAWRPEQHASDPLDRLPEPGRERRVRIALLALALLCAAIALGYLAVTFAPALTGRT